MPQGSLKNYLGLAKRASAVVFGIDNIKSYRKPIFCIILCSSAGEKLKSSIEIISKNKGIPLKILQSGTLDEMLNTQNCKVIAITNKSFIEPIFKCEE